MLPEQWCSKYTWRSRTMNVHAYRLPTDVIPQQSTIALEARLGSDAFSGSVAIGIDIARPCQTIDIHARDLTLSDVRLTTDGRTFTATVAIDTERERAL